MANQNLFNNKTGKKTKDADTVNRAGGTAYEHDPRHKLAQLAVTGCLGDTFYANAKSQLDDIKDILDNISDVEFIGKVAIYARERGFMKDMPALICVHLLTRGEKGQAVLNKIFHRVIDNARMIRNFFQILRSGQFGRKSLGSMASRLIGEWMNRQPDHVLFRASIGNNPSLKDIIRMAKQRPKDKNREALHAYICGWKHDKELLPDIVKQYEAFKAGETKEVPKVDFRMLSSMDLGKREWTEIAKNAPWMMTRMNLNTFVRHEVFEDEEMVDLVAARLADPDLVKRARAFPYQLMMAYLSTNDVPKKIKDALEEAMEISLENVPEIAGKVWVCPDVSGSMQSPITGGRGSATSTVRCVDVAALIASAIVRRNPEAGVLPFHNDVVKVKINPNDPIMKNVQKLNRGGGATNLSAPLCQINRNKEHVDMVIFVSDNQSWLDSMAKFGWNRREATATMKEWDKIKERCPDAKMVCIDIQPYGDSQAQDREDIMNIGGFSDQVFEILEMFAYDRLSPENWIGEVDKIDLSR